MTTQTLYDDFMDTWDALKGTPGYMMNSVSALPVFMLSSWLEVVIQDNLPVGQTDMEKRLWLSVSRGAQSWFNFSFFNVYEGTDAGIEANRQAIANIPRPK